MDPQLSLIMANQAQVRKGDLVYDPFAGTGSLLIAASQFGGYTFGTDIDYLMLHGRTRPTRISQKVNKNLSEISLSQ
jgi:tRNA (guanine10-N2)-methyltransferase